MDIKGHLATRAPAQATPITNMRVLRRHDGSGFSSTTGVGDFRWPSAGDKRGLPWPLDNPVAESYGVAEEAAGAAAPAFPFQLLRR